MDLLTKNFKTMLRACAIVLVLGGNILQAQRALKLTGSELVEVQDVECGFVDGSWIPGRVLRNGNFLAFVGELRLLKKRIQKLQPGQQRKLITLRKRSRTLRKALPAQRALCQQALVADEGAISPQAVLAGNLIRVNCGGTVPYLDSQNALWGADVGISSGSRDIYVTLSEVMGTDQQPLFQTERNGDFFSYAFVVEPGEYVVRVILAEIYWSAPDQRIMSIFAEGSPIVENLDIYAGVGAFNASSVEGRVENLDGVMNIELVGIRERAKCSAIEIIKL